MMRAILECCSRVWNPHTKEYINKVEMVQRHLERYVTNGTNIADHWLPILQTPKLPTRENDVIQDGVEIT